jgi:hypothetical protein
LAEPVAAPAARTGIGWMWLTPRLSWSMQRHMVTWNRDRWLLTAFRQGAHRADMPSSWDDVGIKVNLSCSPLLMERGWFHFGRLARRAEAGWLVALRQTGREPVQCRVTTHHWSRAVRITCSPYSPPRPGRWLLTQAGNRDGDTLGSPETR